MKSAYSGILLDCERKAILERHPQINHMTAVNKKQLICCLHCVTNMYQDNFMRTHITIITVHGEWKMELCPVTEEDIQNLIRKVKKLPAHVIFG